MGRVDRRRAPRTPVDGCSVLEAHDVPGGYAHTFRMRDYRFCAQVHYVFGCGEGETTTARSTPSVRSSMRCRSAPALFLQGFHHAAVAGQRHRIPNGLSKSRTA